MASGKMKKAIQKFAKQFAFLPGMQNAEKLFRQHHIPVLEMGGSQHAADLLRAWKPALSLLQHRDYGLSAMSEHEAAHALFIASSYSGNTEETIPGYEEVRQRGCAVADIAVGGKLHAMAKCNGLKKFFADMALSCH